MVLKLAYNGNHIHKLAYALFASCVNIKKKGDKFYSSSEKISFSQNQTISKGGTTVTPEAIRFVASLRYKFYSLFAAAMNASVSITAHSYSSNFPIAYWVDADHQLNYLSVYAHTAPDELIPSRPLLLRVAINKGAGRVIVKVGSELKSVNQGWQFELTILPEELLDFLPWIVNLVKVQSKRSLEVSQSPPYRLEFIAPAVGLFDSAWTEKAFIQGNASNGISLKPEKISNISCNFEVKAS